jgi:hypothetical protein
MESISRTHIETIVQDIILKNNIFIQPPLKEAIEIYKKEAIQFLSKYINQPLNYILHDVFRYKHTWDHYSLNILFVNILLDLDAVHHTNNEFIHSFLQLLLVSIRADPEKRIPVKETLLRFRRLCYETDVRIFRQLSYCLSRNAMDV